jgi:phage shock protein C
MNDRLYRSVDDRVLAGVCGGLAVRLAVDPSLVRIGYAIVALLTGIFPLLVLYVIMAVVVPEEPTGFAGIGRAPTPPGPDAVPGWTAPGSAQWQAGPAPVNASSETPAPEAGTAAVPDGSPPPSPGDPVAVPAAPPSAWSSRAERRRERRRRRDGDPILGIIAGLVLVGLGAWFLVRDRVAIDWGIVWAAGAVALGVVVILAAFRPRR